jgi:hypothetical protein
MVEKNNTNSLNPFVTNKLAVPFLRIPEVYAIHVSVLGFSAVPKYSPNSHVTANAQNETAHC